LLEALNDFPIGYYDGFRIAFGFNHQFEDIQQLACIASRIPQHGIRLLQLDILLLQINVLFQGIVNKAEQIFLLQRLQHIELATRQQRTDDFEGRILGRSTDECHHTRLNSSQKRVLLRLAEAMDFVDEEDGTCL